MELTEDKPVEYWYRVQDGDLNPNGKISILLRSYRVLEYTQKGVWLSTPWRSQGGVGRGQPECKTFVLLSANRRFAYPTKEEALESYRQRKRRQAQLLDFQLRNTERMLAAFSSKVITPEIFESEKIRSEYRHTGSFMTGDQGYTVIPVEDGKDSCFSGLVFGD